VDDRHTFREGILGGRQSVTGFRVLTTDGNAGRISWAGYEPGDNYLVLTTGWLRKAHRLLPAGAVTSVGDGEVRVALSRSEIEDLPRVDHPQKTRLDDDGTSLPWVL
jgi:hypothetical protein